MWERILKNIQMVEVHEKYIDVLFAIVWNQKCQNILYKKIS